MKKYNKSNIPLAQTLRKNMTPWERKLWYEYLNKYPIRFQRQKAIGEYIVDFYCAKAQLVLELDGGGHYQETQAAADAERTEQLEQMGLRVLRICNLDIDQNFRGVCEFLDMKVRNSLPQSRCRSTAPSSEGALVAPKKIFALGFFDGVHLGHQALLEQCCVLARQLDAIPCAITFDRHPQALFAPTTPPLINSIEDRIALLKQFGIEEVCTFPTTKEVMSTSWQAFLEDLLQRGAVGFVCGDDFRFGCRGEGNAEKLRAFCDERALPCIIVGEQTLDDRRICSTHIRTLIESGNMESAVRFLGHPHILSGEVTRGRQLGRTIGVPTANIPIEVVVPKCGVYACKCIIDGKEHVAVTNVGSRPTVGGHEIRAESWILDFDGDLYGKPITLQFYKFLRPEQKFDSLEELRAQIQKDADQARKMIGHSQGPL